MSEGGPDSVRDRLRTAVDFGKPSGLSACRLPVAHSRAKSGERSVVRCATLAPWRSTRGGPAIAGVMLGHALVYVIYCTMGNQNAGSSIPLVVLAMIIFGIFWTTLSAALAALHKPNGIRSWHIVFANAAP